MADHDRDVNSSHIELSAAELDAARWQFIESLITPGFVFPAPSEDVPPALIAIRARERERLSSDWAYLSRYRDDNARVIADGKPEVVFIGSSTTENWLAADPEFFSPGRVNRGIGGQTSGHLLLRFMPDVVRLQPRFVHIMVGVNDIAGNAGPVHDDDYSNNLEAMATLADRFGILVIIGSVLPANRIPWNPTVNPVARIAAFNEWLTRFAAQRGYPFADYFSALVGEGGEMRAEFTNDGVHPHRDGYARMRPIAAVALEEASALR